MRRQQAATVRKDRTVTNPTFRLRQTKVIRAFLPTYLPEHGREYECLFDPTIQITSEYDKITGLLLEYPEEAYTLTVTVHRKEEGSDRITIRITSTGKSRVQTFYDKVADHLAKHLCEQITKSPEKTDEIIRSVLL